MRQEPQVSTSASSQIHLDFNIGGMHCAACARRIERKVGTLDGIEQAAVNLATERLRVSISPQPVLGDSVTATSTSAVSDTPANDINIGDLNSSIINAVEAAGFSAQPQTQIQPQTQPTDPDRTTISIDGMHCAACVGRVERRLAKLDGVQSVSVNIATAAAAVSYDSSKIGIRRLKDEIRAAGYQVGEQLKSSDRRQQHQAAAQGQRRQLAWALAFWLPLFGLEMGGMAGITWPEALRIAVNPLTVGALHLALVLPVVWVSRPLLLDGWRALARGGPNMFSLILLGSGAALVFSLWGWAQVCLGHATAFDTYFPAASTILTLVLCGKYLESRAKDRAGDAIESLLDLQPTTAVLVIDTSDDLLIQTPLEPPIETPTTGASRTIPATENTGEHVINATEIEIGDLLRVRPGERLPADGTVVSGESTVDESLLTGESLPVARSTGDAVVGGSLNRDGSLLVRATRVGRDTTLAGIVKLVEDAQQGQAPIARLADTVAAYFVPTVLAIAFLAAAAWLISGATFGFALNVLVAVLIIACPCSLGLATPAAIMVGTGVGARRGILVKSPQALEAVHRLDTLVLDKTGTVTLGRPQVTDIVPFSGTAATLLALAAAVEKHSEHPLAAAIVARAGQREIEPSRSDGLTVDQQAADQSPLPPATHFRALPGRGAQARVDGRSLLIGNTDLAASSTALDADQRRQAVALEAEGKTVVWVLADGTALGLFALADTPRPNSATAIAGFQRQGIDTILLSGDTETVAATIAAQVGIDRYYAGVLPADKAAVIDRLQAEGRRVGMVGDGVNDAPALALAEVGIALGAGTHAAADAADLVLLNDNLADISVAIDLSRAVMRKIRQNLFWAFAYNCAGIPVAAGALYLFGGPLLDPMLASMAMALSSVSVVGNALRLRRFTPNG